MSNTDPTLWPPPPLRPEPKTTLLKVEGVIIDCAPDALLITNSHACRWLVGILLVWPATMLLPVWFGLLLLANTHSPREFHQFLIDEWFHDPSMTFVFLVLLVAVTVLAWAVYDFLMHRGRFILSHQSGTVNIGDKEAYPVVELEQVIIKPFLSTNIGLLFVYLVRSGGDRRPRWLRALTYPLKGDYTFVAAFRKKEHVEAIAAAIADFAGLPVTHAPK